MRVNFGSVEVQEMKQKFAKLFDEVTELAMIKQKEIDTPPTIYSEDAIQKHMAVIKKNEESMRCFAESAKILETSCMYAVKGMTA